MTTEFDAVTTPSDNIVFVVHGRDNTARESVFTFLRAIGLAPLEWSQALQLARTAAPYIGQVLDRALDRATAIVVLLSPDDLACLRPDLLAGDDPDYERMPTGQARPNVLFEAGMAFGRRPDQTILVELGSVRPFSDIAGRHIVRLDNSVEQRQALAQRLALAGCRVDLTGTDWVRAGDLTAGRRAEFSHSTRQATADLDSGLSGVGKLAATAAWTSPERLSIRIVNTGSGPLADVHASLDHPKDAFLLAGTAKALLTPAAAVTLVIVFTASVGGDILALRISARGEGGVDVEERLQVNVPPCPFDAG